MRAFLATVTITGADDLVDPDELSELSGLYPFVEWGVLCSKSRAGTARYPVPAWQQRLSRAIPNGHFALHLCGEFSRTVMAGARAAAVLSEYAIAGCNHPRLQLNGFHQYRLPDLLVAQRSQEPIILQCNDIASVDAATELSRHYAAIRVLWDPSGGTGKSLLEAPPPLKPPNIMGYTGGITPDNVGVVLDMLNEHNPNGGPFWIDMESGVRTDGNFDLDKVRAVLEQCRAFQGRQS